MSIFDSLFGKPDLAKLVEKRDFRGLIKALKSKDVEIRLQAAQGLGTVACSAFGSKPDQMFDLALVRVGGFMPQSSAAEALFLLHKSNYEMDAIKALLDLIPEDDARVRVAGADALGQVGLMADNPDVGVILGPLLIGVYESDPDSRVRDAAARALMWLSCSMVLGVKSTDRTKAVEYAQMLRKIGAPAVRPLVRALSNQAIAAHAALALVDIGDPAVPALMAALKDSSTNSYAGVTLERMGPRILPGLLAAIRSDSAVAVIGGITLRALAKETPDQIYALIDDPSENVRAAGAVALIGIDTQQALDWLQITLKDPSAYVRGIAVESLAERNPPDLAAILQEALESETDEGVRTELNKALGKLKSS